MHLHRPSAARGHTAIGWLDSRHTFSFADYHDPEWNAFRALRVINEDLVAPAMGFGMHPHRDMEIITWMVAGRIAHRDSLGNGGVLTPGEAQVMSAGTGIMHSEENPSSDEPCHLIQIWIMPSRRGIAAGWAQRRFSVDGQFTAIAAGDGRDGALPITADAALLVGRFATGQTVDVPVPVGRYAWAQVARGRIQIGTTELAAGDGLGWKVDGPDKITTSEAAEVLLFDFG